MRSLVIALSSFLMCIIAATPIYGLTKVENRLVSNGTIVYNVHRLTTSGTSIFDGWGNKVVLVGTTIDHNEFSKGYFSIQDLERIKSNGGNCAEIHLLRFKKMMPQKNVIDASYFANNLDIWISWCEQMNIYCLLDLADFKWTSYGSGMPDWMLDGHGYGFSPYNEGTVDRAYLDFLDTDNPLHDDNRQSYIDLWKFIANRYANNQYVLFGNLNEPICGISVNATQAQHLGITYSTFMEEIVDAIRSAGAEQLVFIDRPYICAVENYYNNLRPINRSNIVWEDHLYVSPGFTLNQWKSIINNQMIRKFVTEFQKPLYIGEYGPYPINMTDWRNILAQQVAFLKSSIVSGYTWHTWGFLEGEYYDGVYNYLDQNGSDYVVQTIFG